MSKKDVLLRCSECLEATNIANKHLCPYDGNAYSDKKKCVHGQTRKPITCLACKYWTQDEKHPSQYGPCMLKGKQFSYTHECWDGESK